MFCIYNYNFIFFYNYSSSEINEKLESSITYKKAIIFFRALFMQTRMMPTYKLLKRLRSETSKSKSREFVSSPPRHPSSQPRKAPRPRVLYKISNAIGHLSESFEEIGFG